MSALELVAQYSSDSDDNDEPSASPILRLPVPDILKKQDPKVDEHVDDPQKHSGKIRSFPHERGNWSTFVYIPCNLGESFTTILTRLSAELSNIEQFHISEDFHVSVSKTIILRYHWITSFTDSLKEAFNNLNCFRINFDLLNVFCNEEKTRTFLALRVTDNFSLKHLNSIVSRTDDVLKEFNLPTFYSDPEFHASLMWCIGDKKRELTGLIPRLQQIFYELLFAEDLSLRVDVDALRCKTGNKSFAFHLN